MVDIDNNKILENIENTRNYEYKYNFINIPWDDRSKISKIGILILLLAIFIATMAGVINNFVMHYREYGSKANASNAINCHTLRVEDKAFVARIHSMETKQLLCVGAVVSATSILASGICVKSGPIRVFLGNPNEPQCKKGFVVNAMETVFHEGIISKKLVLLSSYEDIRICSSPIHIGSNLNWGSLVQIIGRPSARLGRSLSRQHGRLLKGENLPKGFNIKTLKMGNTLCIRSLAKCPVQAGDLLIQNGYLYGISSTSVHLTDENNLACFADLKIVHNELKVLDNYIILS